MTLLSFLSSILILACLGISLIIAKSAKGKSNAYFMLSLLFSFFILIFFIFYLLRAFNLFDIASFFELGALILLLIFSYFHLKFEGIEARGDQ